MLQEWKVVMCMDIPPTYFSFLISSSVSVTWHIANLNIDIFEPNLSFPSEYEPANCLCLGFNYCVFISSVSFTSFYSFFFSSPLEMFPSTVGFSSRRLYYFLCCSNASILWSPLIHIIFLAFNIFNAGVIKGCSSLAHRLLKAFHHELIARDHEVIDQWRVFLQDCLNLES